MYSYITKTTIKTNQTEPKSKHTLNNLGDQQQNLQSSLMYVIYSILNKKGHDSLNKVNKNPIVIVIFTLKLHLSFHSGCLSQGLHGSRPSSIFVSKTLSLDLSLTSANFSWVIIKSLFLVFSLSCQRCGPTPRVCSTIVTEETQRRLYRRYRVFKIPLRYTRGTLRPTTH